VPELYSMAIRTPDLGAWALTKPHTGILILTAGARTSISGFWYSPIGKQGRRSHSPGLTCPECSRTTSPRALGQELTSDRSIILGADASHRIPNIINHRLPTISVY
jgi:hypothetical protein